MSSLFAIFPMGASSPKLLVMGDVMQMRTSSSSMGSSGSIMDSSSLMISTTMPSSMVFMVFPTMSSSGYTSMMLGRTICISIAVRLSV